MESIPKNENTPDSTAATASACHDLADTPHRQTEGDEQHRPQHPSDEMPVPQTRKSPIRLHRSCANSDASGQSQQNPLKASLSFLQE